MLLAGGSIARRWRKSTAFCWRRSEIRSAQSSWRRPIVSRRESIRTIIQEIAMKRLLIVAAAWPLLFASPAFAQLEVADPLTAAPSLGATSPLGIGAGGSVGTTGSPR